MRVLALISLVAVTTAPVKGQSPELTPAEKIIVQVEESGRLSDDRRSFIPPDISLIPPDQKEAVASRLREIAAQKSGVLLGTVSIHPMSADLLLLRMGDKVTIERIVEDYRAYDSMASWGYAARNFRSSLQPKIIPYLADDFSSAEDPNKRITVTPPDGSAEFATGVPARSIFSGVIVTDIIKKSSAFSPAMKAWAHQAFALRLESPGRFRGLMSTWWERNKAAFERGDYQAVVPVAEEDAKAEASTTSTPRLESESAPEPTEKPSIPNTKESQPTSAPTAKPGVSTWLWMVGLAGLAVILILVWKRRS